MPLIPVLALGGRGRQISEFKSSLLGLHREFHTQLRKDFLRMFPKRHQGMQCRIHLQVPLYPHTNKITLESQIHTKKTSLNNKNKARCGDPCLIPALRKADVAGYLYTV